MSDTYAYGNEVREHGSGRILGVFSSHWAAVAATIRMSEPDFRSLGGDRVEDLSVEQTIHQTR